MAQGMWQGFFRYWLPVLLYVILIFTLSSIPRLAPPFHFPNSDKMVHVMEYSVLGFLMTRALRTIPLLHPVLAAGLLALGTGSVIGALDEVYQKGTPGRVSSASDWLADTIGLTIAFLIYSLHQRRHAAALARKGER